MVDASLRNLLSWQRLYQAALSETDRGKLTDLVAEVETAIKRRISELSNAKEYGSRMGCYDAGRQASRTDQVRKTGPASLEAEVRFRR